MIRTIGFAVLGAALLALPPPSTARAQSCSGGNSSGGGSSGGGSSSGGGGTTSTDQDVEVCRDTTEITGLEECTRFGRGWDIGEWPALTLSLALSLRHVDVDALALSGTSTHDENPYIWRLSEGDLSDATAFQFALRGTGFVTRNLYVGVEGGIGGGSISGPTLDTGMLELEPRAALVLTAGALFGFAIPLGPLALRTELVAGVRALHVTLESRHGDCVTTTGAWSSAPWVEPRIGLDWYATPWLTVGAFGGADIANGAAWHGGLSFGVHTRSFDAQ